MSPFADWFLRAIQFLKQNGGGGGDRKNDQTLKKIKIIIKLTI